MNLKKEFYDRDETGRKFAVESRQLQLEYQKPVKVEQKFPRKRNKPLLSSLHRYEDVNHHFIMTNNNKNNMNIESYVQNLLYPATKEELIDSALMNGAPVDVIKVLEQFPEREYKSTADVYREYSEIGMDDENVLDDKEEKSLGTDGE